MCLTFYSYILYLINIFYILNSMLYYSYHLTVSYSAPHNPSKTHTNTISMQNLFGDLYFSTISFRALFYWSSSRLVISTSLFKVFIYSIV